MTRHSPSLVVSIVSLLSFALALLALGLSAWFDDRIHDRADLAKLDLVPLLAIIPRGTHAKTPKLLGARERG